MTESPPASAPDVAWVPADRRWLGLDKRSLGPALFVLAVVIVVTIELDRALTGGLLDVIEVLAQPGGGPPPHRHSFGEWFLVREGELTLGEERDGEVVTTAVLGPGDSAWVGPGVVHGRKVTLRLS